MCRVYSVFDLNAEEVVGMTVGDFSHFGFRSRCGEGCGYDRR